MAQISSALNFGMCYRVARGLQLKVLLEMKPGRLVGGTVGLSAGGGLVLCYLFVTVIRTTKVTA